MDQSETFQDYVGDFGNYSWVVLFVNAPMDVVSKVYGETLQREMGHNLPITTSFPKQADQYGPTGAVVQVIDSDWVIIFHHVGRYIPLDSASDFSQKLQAKVLVFSGEDTSGTVDCELFSPENTKTRYQTTEDFEEEAEIYEEMAEELEAAGVSPQPSTIIDSYEKFFQSLGIQTVELTLDESRSKAFVSEDYQHQIQRVDLIIQPL
ncbi:hypothetical protein [Acaryochloris marina]|uniref:hypothetical protein n=1 Tax=Acaryochloris marina TaxID=155978 RepID=UPI001BAF1DBE|nr:hypothetical protein [Acaryochloris marina]QUY42943.1 hypothetical protein I1H34_01895 [Acaryochloris marina S15]